MTPTTLAHAGGIDEILMIVAPLVIFFWLRHLNRKKSRQEKPDGETNHQSQA